MRHPLLNHQFSSRFAATTVTLLALVASLGCSTDTTPATTAACTAGQHKCVDGKLASCTDAGTWTTPVACDAPMECHALDGKVDHCMVMGTMDAMTHGDGETHDMDGMAHGDGGTHDMDGMAHGDGGTHDMDGMAHGDGGTHDMDGMAHGDGGMHSADGK